MQRKWRDLLELATRNRMVSLETIDSGLRTVTDESELVELVEWWLNAGLLWVPI